MRRKSLYLIIAIVMLIGLYEINKAEETYYFEKEEDCYMCFYLRKKAKRKILCIGKGQSRRAALKDARVKAEMIKNITGTSNIDIKRIQ